MIPDTASGIAAHKRLAGILPRRVYVMPGSGVDVDDDACMVSAKAVKPAAVSSVGYRKGDALRITGGRLAGETVTFDKADGHNVSGDRMIRVRRKHGGAVVALTDVEPA